MADDLRFALDEACDRYSCLAVAKVYKCDNSLILNVQVRLPEEAILKCHSCTFVNCSNTFNPSNFTSIDQSLSLNVAVIAWNSDNVVFAVNVSVLIELVNACKEESNDLLSAKCVFLPLVQNFVTDFAIFKLDYFMSQKSIFEC